MTQSMLVRFLSCRERFRLKYVLGLEPHDRWNHRLGYGHMWHACEEAMASERAHFGEEVGTTLWMDNLRDFTAKALAAYPMQGDDIIKWSNVCAVQFPEYRKYWHDHPDVRDRTPLFQEKVFDVPYKLPSGRVVRLRGKWDSVDLIGRGIYLQENKTKGDVDKSQIERQLKFDLQTMMYLIALVESDTEVVPPVPVRGVRYNVVRRPLSGGRGGIVPHKAKATKKGYTPAETMVDFYKRLHRDYIAAEPEHYFFRVRAEVSSTDMQVFRETCLTPLLETVCDWYDWVCNPNKKALVLMGQDKLPHASVAGLHYRTPFGVYSALEEGGATEYDAYLETGSTAGLRRVKTLFPELQ